MTHCQPGIKTVKSGFFWSVIRWVLLNVCNNFTYTGTLTELILHSNVSAVIWNFKLKPLGYLLTNQPRTANLQNAFFHFAAIIFNAFCIAYNWIMSLLFELICWNSRRDLKRHRSGNELCESEILPLHMTLAHCLFQHSRQHLSAIYQAFTKQKIKKWPNISTDIRRMTLTLIVTQHLGLPLIIVKAVAGTWAPAHVCLCCVAGVVLFIKHCLIKRARGRYKIATGTFFWKNDITIYK